MIKFHLSQDKSLQMSFFLEGNPRDFKDFQSSFGFPILSLSFPITKFFFLSFIIRWTLFRDFL